MPIDYRKLSAFVRKHGSVVILARRGRTRRLKSGDFDVFDLIEKADKFRFEGKMYTRAEFENLLDESE